MDIIFKIAMFSLPFENLFFAPSAGWATITPIILFVYVIFNYKLVLKSIRMYGKIFSFLILILVPLSIINYLLIEETNMTNVMNSIFSLVLGLSNFIAFDIYFNQKKKDVKDIVDIIIKTYLISIMVGIVQFVAIKLNISAIKNIFDVLSKRNYTNMGKVQFTFTEPSYIGMHLFGILLPIYIISKDKRLLKLIIIYLSIALVLSSSVKLIIDTIAVLLVIFVLKNIKNKKIIISFIVAIPILLVSINILYNNNNRIRSIIDKGIYADSSLASRYFRINASFKGYKKDRLHFLYGYGLGNSIIPMKKGYKEAYIEYDNDWMLEVDRIGRESYTSDSESLCLYIKVISEFGVVTLILLIIYIYKLRKNCNNNDLKNYMWIMLYLYIQFESYAFYTIWLYIVFLKIYEKEKMEKNDESRKNIYKIN